MKIVINGFVLSRLLIGCFFVVSGGLKLLSPYENFLYVVQSYEIHTASLDRMIAWVVPWTEFLAGIFLVCGLWLKIVLKTLAFLIAGFILVVAQAILRNLPIRECGCFGELFSVPLPAVLLIDNSLLLLTWWLLKKIDKTKNFSLDSYFVTSEFQKRNSDSRSFLTKTSAGTR